MDERNFIAIATYDYSLQKDKQHNNTILLILDLSDISGGICNVNADGDISIQEIVPSPGKASFFSRLAKEIGSNEVDIYALWQKQRQDVNKKLKAYLKNSERNYPLLQSTAKTLDCADLIHLYEQDQSRIIEMLRSVDEMLQRNRIDQETMRILLSGQEASFAPAVFTVFSFFNSDEPWLADDRFVQLDNETDPSLFVQTGESILQEQENKIFGHNVSIVCRINIGNEKRLPEHLIVLADKDNKTKNMANPKYGKEIYLTDQTELTLSVDGKRICCSLRNQGIYEGIYQSGLRIADKHVELCFSRTDDPSDQVFIPISL